MSKVKSRDKVIELFEKSINQNKIYGDVFSFKEISNHLDGDFENQYQAVAKLLKRLEKNYLIAYFGSKTSKTNMKLLLKRKYDYNKGWPDYAERVYLYTPKSGKLHKKLLKRFGRMNKNLISEIAFLYRVIEVISKFQEMEFYDVQTVKEGVEERGETLTDEEAKNKVIRMKKKVMAYYGERCKDNKILRVLEFDPVMYYLATNPVKTKPEEYIPERDFIKNISEPMFNKLEDLYSKSKNI